MKTSPEIVLGGRVIGFEKVEEFGGDIVVPGSTGGIPSQLVEQHVHSAFGLSCPLSQLNVPPLSLFPKQNP